MSRLARMSFPVIVPLLLLAARSVPAADDEQQGALLTGQFALGYRAVGVHGQDNKYKEQYNLQKGPRLFDLNLLFKPSEQLRGFADRLQLDVDHYGGDPFESLHLSVQKYGDYSFQYTRTKDTYFYSDIILPESVANSRAETGGDFRTFNFDRVHDLGRLDITPTKAAKLHFAFDRFTKLGTSTLPIDYSRDDYLFTAPIDETQNRYGAGLEYAWDKVTLSFNETVRDYKNAVELFLPGSSRGANPSNADRLDDYLLDQPYDYRSYDHTARLVARPCKGWIVTGSALFEHLNLNATADQTQAGLDPSGKPLTPTEISGAGKISRHTNLFDLDTTYMFSERVGVLAAAWHKRLSQNGELSFGDLNQGQWHLRTSGGRAGLTFDLPAQVTVTGGVQYEHREVTNAHSESGVVEDEPKATTHDVGFFGSAKWVPNKKLNVTAELEATSYTDPYTLSSPTDRQRLRVRAKYALKKGFFVSGSFLYNKFKNDDSGWDAHYNDGNLRFGYQGKTVVVSAGYGHVDIKRSITQGVTSTDNGALLFTVPVLYNGRTDLIDGQARWEATKQWALGGDLRYYTNGGSWPLQRHDYRGYVEYMWRHYVAHAGYRYLKYNEKPVNFDDYKANIGEFSVGYRW